MAETLRDALLEHYRLRPDHLSFRCHTPAGTTDLTFRTLVESGSRVARAMHAAGAGRGDIAVLILPQDAALFSAYAGALLGGLAPSILAEPSFKLNPAHYVEELSALLARLEARILITDRATAEHLRLEGDTLGTARILLAGDIDQSPAPIPDVEVAPDDIALLQHSSGSTGLKKGVALSHAAVLTQIRLYAAAVPISHADRIASWLPVYHDMGLIACTLTPLVLGVPVYTMSALHWVTRPALFFKVIADNQCTLAWMPNFAYEFLAARTRASQMAGVRLDSMRGWINCAEPTVASSHRRFVEAFAGFGVSAATLQTCYAMAETTFAVTQTTADDPPRVEVVDREQYQTHRRAVPTMDASRGVELMSGGRALADTRLRIVAEDGRELPERHVGEVVINSPSGFTGYFKDPDLTAAVLSDGWYRSGDLGYLADGHLFITGRKKDLLIIAGKNYYPQDIERIVSGVDGVYPGRVVALGLDDPRIGTQRLIVIAERSSEAVDEPELSANIRQTLAADLDCVIDDLRVVPHMWLLKTSSGKIARAPNLKRYLEELVPGDTSGPRPESAA